MSIQIGPVTLSDPVILAPMSGVTDMPFRRLVKRHGTGLVVSEMIASEAMIRETRQSMSMARNAVDEQPMAVQLAGCEPAVMAEAAKLNEDRGAAIIDINFGCPVKKVVNGEAGSALMRDEIKAAKILEATVQAGKIPIVVNGDIVTVEDAARAKEDSGADGVMVGRGAYGRPWFLKQVMQFL